MSEFGGPEWPYIAEDTLLPDYSPSPNSEPLRIVAGDTISFIRTIPQYPASQGWGLVYAMRGVPGSAPNFQSVASGDAHQITVLPAVTNTWGAGKYAIQGRAVNANIGETHIIYRSYVQVDASLELQPNTFDVRTHAAKCLAAIEAVLEQRADDDVLDTEIEGTKIGRIPVAELLKFRDRYRAEVQFENAQARLANGQESGRRVLARFSPPGFG